MLYLSSALLTMVIIIIPGKTIQIFHKGVYGFQIPQLQFTFAALFLSLKI